MLWHDGQLYLIDFDESYDLTNWDKETSKNVMLLEKFCSGFNLSTEDSFQLESLLKEADKKNLENKKISFRSLLCQSVNLERWCHHLNDN